MSRKEKNQKRPRTEGFHVRTILEGRKKRISFIICVGNKFLYWKIQTLICELILTNKFWYFSLIFSSEIAIYVTRVQSATLSPEGDRATLEGDNDP